MSFASDGAEENMLSVALLKIIKNMIYGLVKKLQMHLYIFWTISILDLVLSFIGKM